MPVSRPAAQWRAARCDPGARHRPRRTRLNALRWQRLFPLAELAELAEGRLRGAPVDGGELVICRTREGLYALDNTRSHACARTDEGRLRGTRLVCPLHGAAFDVRTGEAVGGQATAPLRTHAVRVVDGTVEIGVETRARRGT